MPALVGGRTCGIAPLWPHSQRSCCMISVSPMMVRFAHLADVIEGVDFVNGIRLSNQDQAAACGSFWTPNSDLTIAPPIATTSQVAGINLAMPFDPLPQPFNE